MEQQDLTHLNVQKDLILYYFPNFASFNIPMYERIRHGEQHLVSCPSKLKQTKTPKEDDLSKKKTNGILVEKMDS